MIQEWQDWLPPKNRFLLFIIQIYQMYQSLTLQIVLFLPRTIHGVLK